VCKSLLFWSFHVLIMIGYNESLFLSPINVMQNYVAMYVDGLVVDSIYFVNSTAPLSESHFIK
jgi:hypothetical protein